MAGKPGQARCGAFLLPAKSAYSRDVVKIWIDEQADQQDGVEFMVKVKPAPRRGARKASARGRSRRKTSETTRAAPGVSWPSEDQVVPSNLSLHELFEQQARQMIDRADLDEEQKQNILVAMSCPCCGAGAMSFTAKLRR
jgi:hypothetical protein